MSVSPSSSGSRTLMSKRRHAGGDLPQRLGYVAAVHEPIHGNVEREGETPKHFEVVEVATSLDEGNVGFGANACRLREAARTQPPSKASETQAFAERVEVIGSHDYTRSRDYKGSQPHLRRLPWYPLRNK